MLHFLKLIRPANLIIIALTMYGLRLLILSVLLPEASQDFSIFNEPDFFLLVLSTVIIAAGGNIINDYFDVKIDRINKPESLIIDKYIKRRVAMLTHFTMNFVAVMIGLYLGIKYGNWWPVIFHLFTTSVLWFYSLSLKRKFLIGNVSIAILTALVPMLVLFFYGDLFTITLRPPVNDAFALKFILVYSFFAFLTTLIREIQKDFADIKGDAANGCKTVPIYIGEKNGRMLIYALFIITLIAFNFVITYTFDHFKYFIYLLLTVDLTMIFSFYFSYTAHDRNSWLRAATTMKICMLAGVLFIFFLIYA